MTTKAALPWLREHGGKAAQRLAALGGRRLRGEVGRLRHRAYVLSGRKPDPDVADDILADRIRSQIGTLEKRLHVPRVHVMVNDHIAMLHGAVPGPTEADEIESAVSRVSGVAGVESHLHIGLGPASSRRSSGTFQPSPAWTRLMRAIEACRVSEHRERIIARAVLSTLVERIPRDEREQLLRHLPSDVRSLATPPRRYGAAKRMKTVEALTSTVASRSGVGLNKARDVTMAVMKTLKQLVPEEAHDVASTLPADLRAFWDEA